MISDIKKFSRESISKGQASFGLAEVAKRGEPVRIVGLGRLLEVEPIPNGLDLAHPHTGGVYRLTLTVKVAKAWLRPDLDTKAPQHIETDVRHIARALGAPVEMWAPGATVLFRGPGQHTRFATVMP